MKKALFIILLITACKRSDILPAHDTLTNTKWYSYMYGTVPGHEIYKVLEFLPGEQLKIDYKAGKMKDLLQVGTFKYYLTDQKFVIYSAKDSLMFGEVKGDKIHFDNKVFDRL